MKKIIYITLVFLLIFTGCSKETTVEPIDIQKNIYTEIDRKLGESSTEEYFYRINNLEEDESLKLDLVSYDGLSETKLIDSSPDKYEALYIKIEDDKLIFAEIIDLRNSEVGNTVSYESDENFMANRAKHSIAKHLEKRETLDKELVLYQKDMSDEGTIVFNSYDDEDNKTHVNDLKKQFGYAVIISKVKDKEIE